MHSNARKSKCFKQFLILFSVLLTYLILPTSSEGVVITRGPYIQSTSPNSAVVRWRTDVNADSKVKYGTSNGSYPNEAKNTTHILVYGEKKVGPASYYGGSGNDFNISKRNKTNAVYIWEPDPWTSVNAKKRIGDSSSDKDALKSIVKEIVDMSDWNPSVSSKDDIAFLIYGSGKRIAESYDGAAGHGDTGKRPRLHIKYKVGSNPSVTISRTASTSRYDAEEHLVTGKVYATSTDLELGVERQTNNTFSQVVGIKFKNTNIPKGATIQEAYIEFTVDETNNKYKNHEVIITGLQANTKYFYKIMNGSTTLVSGSNYYFTTHPATGVAKAKTIWVLGDSGQGGFENNGGNEGARARIVRDAFKNNNNGSYHADLVLMLGDNAYNHGNDDEYQHAMFENMYENTLRNSALFPVLGNHEFHQTPSMNITNSMYQTGVYYEIFTLPRAAELGGKASGTEAYYSFDYGQIHFICLESVTPINNQSFEDAMEAWLDDDLATTNQKWIIALWHHPPYSWGTHNTDNSIENESEYMREDVKILKKLEDNGVDMVFIGHSHVYERTMLINGHYSESGNYNAATMEIDSGDGNPDAGGDGAYSQNSSDEGTVYVLAGSASKRGGTGIKFTDGSPTTFYPAMSQAFRRLGSVKLVVNGNGNALDVYFIGQNNTNNNTELDVYQYGQQDHFRLVQ